MAKKETMTETKQFDADVAQLIQLVTHSIYSNTDIFLRELLSNSNDAIQKARMLSLQDTSYLGEETDLQITIETDPDAKTITITDTGIGMNRDEVISNIGTIAKSWTKAFLESLEKSNKAKKDAKKEGEWSMNSDLIGQFGIGFYSSFMVAKKVELETKANGSDAVKWTSEWDGAYELDVSTKTTRWTTITLYLNNLDDNDAYADHYRLRGLIKTHSNYVPVPIMMKKMEDMKPSDEWEQINQMQSLWTKQKSSIKNEEYDEFYKTMTYSQEWPLDTIHVSIEWLVNFKAMLFIPKQPGMFEQMQGGGNDQEYGPSLYVQNVLIIEKAKDLLPVRLRFVKWVVETPDLSLNVSREILQDNKVLDKIKQALIKEVLKSLSYLAKTEPDAYASFFAHYGRYLKEWVHYEKELQDDIAWLLLYSTLQVEKPRTLAQIADATSRDLPEAPSAKADDKDWADDKKADAPESLPPLYYLTWKSITEIKHSPYLEQFKTHKTDVILMGDPLDEYVVNGLQEYKEFNLTSATSPDIHLGDQEEQEVKKKETEKKSTENKDALEFFAKTIWEEKLEKVEFTHKIWDNLWVLVTPEGLPSPQMERIMKSMGQDVPPTKRILQVNDQHPLIKKVLDKGEGNEEIMQYVYEQAILLEWWELEDMAWFVKRVNGLIG